MNYWCETLHYEEVSTDINGNPRGYGEAGFNEKARFYFDIKLVYSESHTDTIERTLEDIEILKVECLRWDTAGHELIQDVTQFGAPEAVEVEMKKRVIDDFNSGCLTPTRVQEYNNV